MQLHQLLLVKKVRNSNNGSLEFVCGLSECGDKLPNRDDADSETRTDFYKVVSCFYCDTAFDDDDS